MKRKYLLSLTLAAGLLSAVAARSECQIQLSEAQIDYEAVTRGELLSRPGNALSASELRTGEAREFDIMVNCDHPATLTLQFIGPAKTGDSYRFGEQGRATLVLHDVMIDDSHVDIVGAGKRESQMAFTAGNVLSFWKEDAPATGSTLRGRVTVTTRMPSDATRVGERQTWKLDGSFHVGGG